MKNTKVKHMKKEMTKAELEKHQKAGHTPYDSRCKDCLLGGIKDRPHYRRPEREENTLAVDVSGRYKPGVGPEGKNYKYMLVATFNAAKKKWNNVESEEEAEEKTDESYKDVLVEETQIVLKTVKELTSKEASDRAKAKIKMVKLAPQKEVDLSSDEESSSSEDIKDDEKAPIKQPQGKVQFVFINFEAIPRTIQ